MKTIEYRAQYTGGLSRDGGRAPWLVEGDVEYEVIRVRARNINSGYAKALKRALEPLGNGRVREIGALEFWQVV